MTTKTESINKENLEGTIIRISVKDGNVVEKLFKDRLRERFALEVSRYIKEEKRYMFNKEYATECFFGERKINEVDKAVINKEIGAFNISDYKSLREFLSESAKEYKEYYDKDNCYFDQINIEEVIFNRVKAWVDSNRDNIITDCLIFSREELKSSISSVTGVNGKEDIDATMSLSDKELVELIYNEIVEDPFSYIHLYEDANLEEVVEKGNRYTTKY